MTKIFRKKYIKSRKTKKSKKNRKSKKRVIHGGVFGSCPEGYTMKKDPNSPFRYSCKKI